MTREGVDFDERTVVEQVGDSLAGGQLALCVDLLDRCLTDRVLGLVEAIAQVSELSRGGVDVRRRFRVLGGTRHGLDAIHSAWRGCRPG